MRMATSFGTEFEVHDPEHKLTPRQREVLVWVVEGKENEAIATLLGITLGTVKFHMVRLLRHFDAPNRQLLISRAFKAGMVRARQLVIGLLILGTVAPHYGDPTIYVRMPRTARVRTAKRHETDEHPVIQITNLVDLHTGDKEEA